MSRVVGLSVAGLALLLAAAGVLFLDRYSTGLPALLLCPVAAAILAASLLPNSRLGSAFLAVLFSAANLWLFTTFISLTHERRFGGVDPEGYAAFQFLMMAGGFAIAPLFAAGIANLNRPSSNVR